jgi:hypothetical protein
MTPIAYRFKLWKSGDSSITVRVHVDGSCTLDGLPEIPRGEAPTFLNTEGFTFSSLSTAP